MPLFLCGAFFVAIVLLCASCASAGATSNADVAPALEAAPRELLLNPVYITDKKRVQLLPTEAIEKPVDALQRITATFRGNAFTADCLLLADDHQLFMTVLNEFGTTLASLVYGDGNVSFDSTVFPKDLKAEYIVFDVQLCFYSVSALKKALESAGLRLDVTVDSQNTETRAIYSGKKLIASIEKKAGLITYKNVLRAYSYTLSGAY